MELVHFNSEHPLSPSEDHAQADVMCYGCNKPIILGSTVYTCTTSITSTESGCDNFFLHKTCAELSPKLEFSMHPQHPLTLYPRPLYNLDCSVCSVEWKWFTYQCIHCHFNICMACVSQERNFHHESHKQHSLSLVPRQALFKCDACGTLDKDLSYFCNTCPFWIHKSCAASPSTISHRYHEDHPLVLTYSVPTRYRAFEFCCSICTKQLDRSHWVYYCIHCRYFAHIKCATRTSTRDAENEDNGVDDLNLVHLPLPDEPSSMDTIVRQYVKAVSRTDDTTEAPHHINHWAHKDHPLVLFDEIRRNNTNEIMNGNDDQMMCDGCVRPILTDPFYSCIQCKFYLHRICAELPLQFQYHSHKHKLVSAKYTQPKFNVECNKCGYICNGMFFSCELCKFYLDIRCASIPDKIKHEAHIHPLSELKISHKVCKGCKNPFSGSCFGCEGCDFHIEKSCTFMPSTIRHRWDPHPIPLVYPIVKDHSDFFYCELCEEEIDPNYWMYFCRACDKSFHTKCLYPYYGFSNIKFGATMKVDKHPHSLTFVGMKNYKFTLIACGGCGEEIDDGCPVFECEPCYFRLCMNCVPYQTPCLVEACERTEDEGISKLVMVLTILCCVPVFSFVLWAVYQTVLFLWVNLYLFIYILLIIHFVFVTGRALFNFIFSGELYRLYIDNEM